MVKLPEVMGMVMCETIRFDAEVRRMSLERLVPWLESAVFPTHPIRMSAYVELFDGRGEGEMRLTCTRLETEADIHYYSKWCSFPVPGRTSTLEFPIRDLKLPAPGRYVFTLFFDGQPLTRHL